MIKKQKLRQFGFSLIETIVVLAIMGSLTTVVIASFSAFRNGKTLDVAAEQVLSVISESRGKTISSEDAYQYGVHLEAGRVVAFKGAIYSATDPSNAATALSSLVEISNISLAGGGADITFQRLTGKVASNGSFRVRLKADTSRYKSVSVNSAGIIELK